MKEERPVGDERVQEPTIMLLEGETGTMLTSAETRQVIGAFPEVRRAATKWALTMQQRDGRMLVIEPRMIGAIHELLAETEAPSAGEVE
jgi:hypothetical protein